jgi:signal transduction histidine kinase
MDPADKINILVVDDLPEKILVYQSILEELGQNLITALSGAEALKQVLRHDFAVILLDVHMPGMDGFETAALIRNRKKSAHTPIIFVTAFPDEVRAAKGYAHGGVDYILTPVMPEVLRAKVRVFVDLFRMHRQVERQAEERVALAEERAMRAAAEEANRRSAFLAEASRSLANSLDLGATLQGLAGLAVPFLADLSVACLADDQGEPGLTEWAWLDPVRKVAVGPSATFPLPAGWLREALRQVLSTGTIQLRPELEPPAWAVEPQAQGTGDRGQEPGDSKRTAACSPTPDPCPLTPSPDFLLHSAVLLPLAARGKILGALILAYGPSGRHYGAGDIALAEDLACRAGIAMDNTLLIRNIQEGDRRKDEFLAMLAHELRNPLAPIRNAAHVIRLLGPAKPELQKARDVIDRQLQHLARLVDDLLDVSRITRGKISLQLEPLDVATAVASAVETSRPLIDARKHDLTVSLPAQALSVRADVARLAQILSNLLNNAAKYSEEQGRIWLTVAREGNEAVFRVRDTGAGISPEMLHRVFDLFAQADKSLDRSQGGLGIGLTLVRRLVEMHQGSVKAQSEGPGRGSEFIVRLPALDSELPQPNLPTPPTSGECVEGGPAVNGAPASGAVPPALGAGLLTPPGERETINQAALGAGLPTPPPSVTHRILVVDDNVDAADSLALVARLEGHEVHTANDGLVALQEAHAFQPHVILLDIGLPHMDGYEVARRLRTQPGGDRFVLAAVTGYGQGNDRLHAHDAGFDHYLVKPVNLDLLRQILADRKKSSQ